MRDVGRPAFPVLSFRDIARGRLKFPDGHGPDLVHAFTPRESVRNLTLSQVERYGCPYVIHLEDNEMAVQEVVISDYVPSEVTAFLEGAAGISVVIERLLELAPDGVPTTVIWPGYDDAIVSPGRTREAIRRDVGLAEEIVAVLYTGNIHDVNVDEVRVCTRRSVRSAPPATTSSS